MGGCCVSDALNSRYIADLRTISDSNLALLKAIAIHYLAEKNPGMAIKVMNIHLITKSYYMRVESERSELMRIKYQLEKEDYEGMEKAVANERDNLSDTNSVLKGVFYSLRKKFLIFSQDPKKFAKTALADIEIRNDYRELKYKCKKSRIDNQGIEYISRVLNGGNELPDDLNGILRDICEVTSYIATNGYRSVSYDLDSPYIRSYTRGNRSHSIQRSNTRSMSRRKTRRILIPTNPGPSSEEPKTAL